MTPYRPFLCLVLHYLVPRKEAPHRYYAPATREAAKCPTLYSTNDDRIRHHSLIYQLSSEVIGRSIKDNFTKMMGKQDGSPKPKVLYLQYKNTPHSLLLKLDNNKIVDGRFDFAYNHKNRAAIGTFFRKAELRFNGKSPPRDSYGITKYSLYFTIRCTREPTKRLCEIDENMAITDAYEMVLSSLKEATNNESNDVWFSVWPHGSYPTVENTVKEEGRANNLSDD